MLRPSYTSGGLLLACTAAFAVVAFGQLPGHSLFWQELQNTLHTLVFFALTLLLLRHLRHHTPLAQSLFSTYLIAAGSCLLIGIATETAQWMSGRGFGEGDVLRDLAGIAMAALLYALLDRTAAGSRLVSRPAIRGLLATLLVGLLLVSSYPLGALARHYSARNQAFPVILDLRANWAGSFIKHGDAVLTPGACGLGMTGLDLLPAPYPGVSVAEPVPDWSSFRRLVITLDSLNSAPFELTIRVHDRLHDQSYTDRYNRTLPVNPGPNRYTIPLAEIREGPTGRSLELEAIAGVMLFARNPRQARRICMGSMWLEK
ncbi:MAG: hypothetical protein WBO34_08965 [Gammaproteobacteria bacterium]